MQLRGGGIRAGVCEVEGRTLGRSQRDLLTAAPWGALQERRDSAWSIFVNSYLPRYGNRRLDKKAFERHFATLPGPDAALCLSSYMPKPLRRSAILLLLWLGTCFYADILPCNKLRGPGKAIFRMASGSFYREPSKRIMVGGVKRHLVLFSCQVLASAGMGMGEAQRMTPPKGAEIAT